MDIVSAPGRLVRDPDTRRVVDQTAIAVDPTHPYWARLIADEDVVEAPKPVAATEVAPAPEAASQEPQA